MFHSALLHALQWLRPKVLAKFASTKLAQRQSHIRRSIKAVNYDKVFSFIKPFCFLTVKKNFEMSSEDEQHKSSLAAHYLQLKNIRMNPPLESVLSLTTFIQNAAICSSILTTLLFSFFKPVLRPTVRIMQQSSEEGERTLLPTDIP